MIPASIPGIHPSINQYINLSTGMHASMHPSIHPCIHASINLTMHAFVHACMHASIYPCRHACMHPSIHAQCLRTCIHTFRNRPPSSPVLLHIESHGRPRSARWRRVRPRSAQRQVFISAAGHSGPRRPLPPRQRHIRKILGEKSLGLRPNL
jgi:hypothetical protein